jgi:hypothetical protein
MRTPWNNNGNSRWRAFMVGGKARFRDLQMSEGTHLSFDVMVKDRRCHYGKTLEKRQNFLKTESCIEQSRTSPLSRSIAYMHPSTPSEHPFRSHPENNLSIRINRQVKNGLTPWQGMILSNPHPATVLTSRFIALMKTCQLVRNTKVRSTRLLVHSHVPGIFRLKERVGPDSCNKRDNWGKFGLGILTPD